MCDVDNGLEEQKVGLTASQSSTYSGSPASQAIDGSYSVGSCTESSSYNQWLAIDIGQPNVVRAVNVTNDVNLNFRKFLCYSFET